MGWSAMSRNFVLGSIVLMLVTVATWAQTGTSSISGAITDRQKRPVAGATVTLNNRATNASRSVQSTENGTYIFDLIAPGDYQVVVEATGFNKNVTDNVQALIGRTTEHSVQLEVGSVNVTVEVRSSDQGAVINTQDASLGNVLESSQITQLPLEGHNLIDLLSLQPGTTREGYVTGSRADQSNVTLDGVDVNNAQTGNAALPTGGSGLIIGGLDTDRGNITSGPVLRLNSEAIEEFRVTTANGGANQGRSAGAQINLVTKSGTNSFHGAAFESYRGTAFEANDWFSNAAGVPRTPLVRNSFGGGFGGPIWKDKLFFFYSYEGRRDATAQGVTQVVPLASLGQGILNYSYCPDAACATTQTASLTSAQVQQVYADAGLNPAALTALADAAAKYPANDTTQGDGLNTGGFRFNAPTPISLNSHVARLDYALTSTQSLFARVNVIYDHQTLAQYLPGDISPQVWNHPRGLAVGHTWTHGDIVNSARYGYTRQAFTQGGDSTGNDVSFRFVFQPNNETHTLSRVTPVHNITDDVSWTHGRHTLQFGANVRLITNSRTSFANAFDFSTTNPSFYSGAGESLSSAFQNYLDANGLPGDENAKQSLDSISQIQNAATAIIGRFSEYTANFTFNKDGSLLAPGLPTVRKFATQAYEEYLQDSWKVRPHLTLTLGLRYSLERPVYETQGFEVQPTVPLGTYFQDRLNAAAQGGNFVDPIVINRSGPANGGKPMYNWDKNNFQPRIAVAWSPNYSDGLLHSLFGDSGKSVIRGGFAITNDYYGQALAVDWDLNNTLGFTSNFTTPANTFDSSGSNLPPLFTGFDQGAHDQPGVLIPPSLQFPLSQPIDEGGRIETGVDSTLHAPTEYVWNLTYERQLRGGLTLSVSYIGRAGRSLLARRDVAAFNDLRDPKSGMDWYTAGTILEKQRQKGVDTNQIAPIPFFENLFPAGLATLLNNDIGLPDPTDPSHNMFNPSWSNTQAFYALQSRNPAPPPGQDPHQFAGNDWTDAQFAVDFALFDAGLPTKFTQPQYGALSAWSTVANSNYHGLTVSLRQRLNSVVMDFNYTYSHSLDDASGLQSETSAYGNANSNGAFIVNPIRQSDNYGNSDFDIRHLVNASVVWQMPFGRGKKYMSGASAFEDAVLGGWQLSSIYRWNTGLPVGSPFDDARWATNWNVQAYVTPTGPVHTCPNRSTDGTPKLFGGSACDITAIYQSFRNAYPGETGPRNYLRYPGYMNVDIGLGKSFKMPWSEKHLLQIRWDVFNVANLQRFGLIDTSRTGIGVGRDPGLRGLNPPANWSNFTQIQGQPRVFQVGARYSF
jgi:hypothetical protein